MGDYGNQFVHCGTETEMLMLTRCAKLEDLKEEFLSGKLIGCLVVPNWTDTAVIEEI